MKRLSNLDMDLIYIMSVCSEGHLLINSSRRNRLSIPMWQCSTMLTNKLTYGYECISCLIEASEELHEVQLYR